MRKTDSIPAASTSESACTDHQSVQAQMSREHHREHYQPRHKPPVTTLGLALLACAALLLLTHPDKASSAAARTRLHTQRAAVASPHRATAARICHHGPLPTHVCRVVYQQAPAAHVKRRWAVSSQLARLVTREASARFGRVNPASGACGIGQMLPCHKYGPRSCWPSASAQAYCLLHYIRTRYRNPARAWNHETAHGWY